mmetsp:Transcript_11693/g.36500  ORF Transcript_11693/g.36500 Transcript_11693/m.36500 type:complete len:328 (-) Transcript_11693:159-1142(-)
MKRAFVAIGGGDLHGDPGPRCLCFLACAAQPRACGCVGERRVHKRQASVIESRPGLTEKGWPFRACTDTIKPEQVPMQAAQGLSNVRGRVKNIERIGRMHLEVPCDTQLFSTGRHPVRGRVGVREVVHAVELPDTSILEGRLHKPRHSTHWTHTAHLPHLFQLLLVVGQRLQHPNGCVASTNLQQPLGLCEAHQRVEQWPHVLHAHVRIKETCGCPLEGRAVGAQGPRHRRRRELTSVRPIGHRASRLRHSFASHQRPGSSCNLSYRGLSAGSLAHSLSGELGQAAALGLGACKLLPEVLDFPLQLLVAHHGRRAHCGQSQHFNDRP